ncbi:CoA transferase subunit A [Pseudorhodoferax soli]|uniref:Glutaconate CoA-transferase subunit A n=1 Tax=Pseudorhodoferax soli TaxID=545864 RepID=A0A368X662_9BURK|nr:CoA transferase [Pseudorhodoferax soli]RCW63199.1 glutaconate CoA-transferase subunit A [Pseudorhodoferax soli]
MRRMSVEEIAEAIAPGTKLALPAQHMGAAMSVTRELLRIQRGGLHLVCTPTCGMQGDILVGAGLVDTVETSALGLGEAGGAPCFNRAVRAGTVKVLDATCPALLASLLASQKGMPFVPLRGLIGTDVLRHRPEWKVVNNPFGDNDPIVLIPALRPDVALFHARTADRFGNVWIGRMKELSLMAYASAKTFVTVETIVDGNLLENEDTAAGVLPAIYVEGIAESAAGAHPLPLPGHSAGCSADQMAYAKSARTAEGFAAFAASWTDCGVPA